MDYLQAWNSGYEDGKQQSINLINEFCSTQFKSIEDIIRFIREAKEVSNV